ncbi:MAG: glycosyltransferase [Verrucomicrobiota bacterium]
MKKILILTAGFGEGHNAAARGVRDGLARVASGEAEVEMHDLIAQTYPVLFKAILKTYLAIVNRAPRAWGYFYRWLEKKDNFDQDLRKFQRFRTQFTALLERFQPDVVVSVFPSYPYVLNQLLGPDRKCKSVVIVTDSITVNKVWYKSSADFFLVPNEQSAAVVRNGGVAPEKIRTLGFPVSPRFADLPRDRPSPSAGTGRRVLYMINAGPRAAPALVRKLLDLEIELTVTVGRNDELRRAVELVAGDRKIDIVGWSDQLPRLLTESHLLIGKAGGATVQETIAAGCPMIINHIVSGQEEGNAWLIEQTNSGVIARSQNEVVAQVRRAFADNAKQWSEWAVNIGKLSRPRASLDIAEFLMSI